MPFHHPVLIGCSMQNCNQSKLDSGKAWERDYSLVQFIMRLHQNIVFSTCSLNFAADGFWGNKFLIHIFTRLILRPSVSIACSIYCSILQSTRNWSRERPENKATFLHQCFVWLSVTALLVTNSDTAEQSRLLHDPVMICSLHLFRSGPRMHSLSS